MNSFLVSDSAQAALLHLQEIDLADENTLSLLVTLRRSFSAEQAGALLSLARLRKRAIAKFPQADRMFFSAEALEQATAWPVALLRAERLAAVAPMGVLLDLGCGIGGDTLALAQQRSVIAYERDADRLWMARANADALHLSDRIDFRLADWVEELAGGHLPHASAAFVDPARRAHGKRIFRLDDLIPPLSTILRVRERVPVLAVKLMAGVDARELPADAGLEFVSNEGVCKEAVLWLGAPFGAQRWASVHTGKEWRTLVASGKRAPVGDLTTSCVLYEPDPAVIRSGALAELCEQLECHLFDQQIAYLIGDQLHVTPFARSFRIHEVHRFGLKMLNKRLADLEIGQVELKRRGFPVEPETMRTQLRLTKGNRRAVVFLTRRGAEHLMLIGERVAAE